MSAYINSMVRYMSDRLESIDSPSDFIAACREDDEVMFDRRRRVAVLWELIHDDGGEGS